MSKNSQNKRKAKLRQRDQFSRIPLGTPFATLVANVAPMQTPFWEYISRDTVKVSGDDSNTWATGPT